MGWNETFPAGHGKRNTESCKSVKGFGRNLQTGRQVDRRKIKKKKTDRQTDTDVRPNARPKLRPQITWRKSLGYFMEDVFN